MSLEKRIVSLREIPAAIFSEFSISDEPQQHEVFKEDLGAVRSISICLAQETGKNGPFTLVHENRQCPQGRFHSTEFCVYDYPAKLEEFAPRYEGFHHNPVMTIRFFADDPPYKPTPSFHSRWEDGKGFWVKEHLIVRYGDSYYHGASVISDFNDWEFGFFLKVQQYTHQLARTVSIRGHWQREWDPESDFSKKPKEVY